MAVNLFRPIEGIALDPHENMGKERREYRKHYPVSLPLVGLGGPPPGDSQPISSFPVGFRVPGPLPGVGTLSTNRELRQGNSGGTGIGGTSTCFFLLVSQARAYQQE